MSIKRDRTKLKTYFETGDRPTEEEFAELIDSGINQKDDEIHVVNSEVDPDKDPDLKVGVGTDSPKEKLHVDGNIMTSGHLIGDMSNKLPKDKTLQIINDAQIQLYSKDHNSAPGRVVIGANKDPQDPNSGAMIFAKHLTTTGWEQNMIIDHDGKVGIGTNTPQERLHVDGNTEIEGDLQVKKDIYGDDHDWGRLNINASKKGHLGGAYMHMNGSNLHVPDKNGNMVDDGNQGGISFVAAGKGGLNGFNFYHYNQEREDNHINKLTNKGNSKLWDLSVRIDGFGNVGIGASNPQNKLVVYNGADQIDGVDNDTGLTLPTGKGAGKILTSDSDGKAFWRPATDVTNGLWVDEGNGNIRNGNSGNVKITANTLLVESQANNAHTWLPYTDGEIYLTGNADGSGTGDIHFRSYSTNDGYDQHMIVKGNGNVGIGTVDPDTQLEIAAVEKNENSQGILKITGKSTGKDLRLGVQGGNAPYTWIQSHGSVPLKLNPHPAGNITTINENGGNVGVGVSVPTQKLDVNGSLQLEGDIFGRKNGGQFTIKSVKNGGGGYMHLRSSDFSGNNQGGITFVATRGSDKSNGFTFMQNNTSDPGASDWPTLMRINENGYVGIGKSNPQHLLHLASRYTKIKESYHYMNGSGAVSVKSYNNANNQNIWVSLYADGRILAPEINAFSDARIKVIEGVSDKANDLTTLSKIEITDYTHVDVLANGNKPYKKVIGQQLRAVYPQAVSLNKDVIPDVYENANVVGGWIELKTTLKAGENVRIGLKDKESLFEVIAVEENRFKVAEEIKETQVFVYGREVDDFHVVDYDAIAMLNVSATQELAKKVENQQKEIDELKAMVNSLLEKLAQ